MRLTISAMALVFSLVFPLGAPGPAWPSAGIASAARGEHDADPDEEVARKHFEKARVAYAAKNYDLALEEFRAARLVKPLPAFEYNIAVCLDRLERWQEAIYAYERFAAVATPAEAKDARKRVKVLNDRLAELAAGTDPSLQPTRHDDAPPSEKPTPPSRGSKPDVLPFIAALVGVSAVTTFTLGAGFYDEAHGDYTGLSLSCAPYCPVGEVQGPQALANASYTMMAVGGGLAVADVALWMISFLRHPAAAHDEAARSRDNASTVTF